MKWNPKHRSEHMKQGCVLHIDVEGINVQEMGEEPQVSEGGGSRGMVTHPRQILDILGLATDSLQWKFVMLYL